MRQRKRRRKEEGGKEGREEGLKNENPREDDMEYLAQIDLNLIVYE